MHTHLHRPHPSHGRRRAVLAARWAQTAVLAGAGLVSLMVRAEPALPDWQRLPGLDIARTETTIAQFEAHVRATGVVTEAERRGGGEVYEAGWTRKPGWTWRTPYGPATPVRPDEPAVHITHAEAAAYCRWAGGRLPTEAEWLDAAHTERRPHPPAPFETGRRYPYPQGNQPAGGQCLDDCGPAARQRGVAAAAGLWRGHGHARAGQTPAGVNGLHDMGGNVWEWVDDNPGAPPATDRITRGGSWWYGSAPMRAEHTARKPADTAVVYIGWRCVRGR